jgi:hypothetical protein
MWCSIGPKSKLSFSTFDGMKNDHNSTTEDKEKESADYLILGGERDN